ncbi:MULTISPECIES: [FeFe] hydrogenase H-cluster radical SAM maturase HydE [Kosmotoga]|uniref:Radical SAM domain protein n=1 Tax=Kosmotoga olearia (strain ATCC BAA-1733 / DSM 21960 / TBF 19.5.1) TaxID=521045 RepID=C5CDV2_KOSOT|nr:MULTISPECIES: [FeFe] hydrogenase H-cluster radical SAM maturase HydE [Kosmotoga]ACR79121.1 Radical SAM domain protein [Kosmotoga olearia TBF 19.5.1]MDI3523601.1 biotin synthase [Kosmotoga sp.]MDK2953151.1 biotin synthase [Kosmotoga sp.]OAA23817.1 radical SAM protein [Kosmotoga sp. DU53]
MASSRFDIAKKIEVEGSKELQRIVKKVLTEEELSKEEIIYILSLERGEKDRELLFEFSNAIRKDYVGEMFFIKGVIEFSNYCRKNCDYCGIRAANKIPRYRMSEKEIIEIAKTMLPIGVDTIILQSGEDPYYDIEKLERIVSRIKKETHLPVSLSIGERPKTEYLKLKAAGASKTLLKHETMNRKIFESVHPDDDYDKRIDLLLYTVSIGYIAGSGNIIGLPGQTIEDVADDVLFLRDSGVRMVGLGPFIPAKGTPLENHPYGDPELTLNTYAAVRLCIPKVFMPSTTALGTIDEDLQFEGFKVGCNVIMCNFTPEKYRKNYTIYSDKIKVDFFKTAKRMKDMGLKLNPRILKNLEEYKKVII